MGVTDVAVVIPVGTYDEYLEPQLRSVLDQRCRVPFEVVLSVNSADPAVVGAVRSLVDRVGIADLCASWTRRIREERRTPGTWGSRPATPPDVVFCDADDLVHAGWLEALMEGLDEFDAVTGQVVDVFPDERSAKWYPPATPGELPRFLGREYVLTGNLGVRREAFDAVGGFDESLTRCEDIALGWALTRVGIHDRIRRASRHRLRHRAGLRAMLGNTSTSVAE